MAITTNGQGTVVPNQETYTCGDQVSLSAQPANGWNFAGWGGDASGTTTPLTIDYDLGLNITANFTQTGESQIYLPIIVR
ncbi:MAG: hypothetical protein R2867_36415 [Caldilineaceae bacterium]